MRIGSYEKCEVCRSRTFERETRLSASWSQFSRGICEILTFSRMNHCDSTDYASYVSYGQGRRNSSQHAARSHTQPIADERVTSNLQPVILDGAYKSHALTVATRLRSNTNVWSIVDTLHCRSPPVNRRSRFLVYLWLTIRTRFRLLRPVRRLSY